MPCFSDDVGYRRCSSCAVGNYVFQERYGVGRVQVALGYALVEQHSGIGV